MFGIQTSMIRSKKKGLGITNDRVDPSQRFCSFTYNEALMSLNQVLQPRTAVQPVSLDRATRFEMVCDKHSDRHLIKCSHQLYLHKPGGSLLTGSGYGDQNLRLCRTSAPFSTFSFSAEIGFVHLHKPLKLVFLILLSHSSPDLL